MTQTLGDILSAMKPLTETEGRILHIKSAMPLYAKEQVTGADVERLADKLQKLMQQYPHLTTEHYIKRLEDVQFLFAIGNTVSDVETWLEKYLPSQLKNSYGLHKTLK